LTFSFDDRTLLTSLFVEKCRFLPQESSLVLVFGSGSRMVTMVFEWGRDLRGDATLQDSVRSMNRVWHQYGLAVRAAVCESMPTGVNSGLTEQLAMSVPLSRIVTARNATMSKSQLILNTLKAGAAQTRTTLDNVSSRFTRSCAGAAVVL
jgi:hypothetical protein